VCLCCLVEVSVNIDDSAILDQNQFCVPGTEFVPYRRRFCPSSPSIRNPISSGLRPMTITFSCDQCGKIYAAGSEYAGKAMKCKQCGKVMRIPGTAATRQQATSSPRQEANTNRQPPQKPATSAPKPESVAPVMKVSPSTPSNPRPAASSRAVDHDLYDLGEPEPIALTASDTLDHDRRAWSFKPLPGAAPAPRSSVGAQPKPKNPRRAPVGNSSGISAKAAATGGVGAVAIALFCFRLLRIAGGVGRAVTHGQDPAIAEPPPAIIAQAPANLPAPTVPGFPEPGPSRQIEPGILLHEIRLGPPLAGPGTPPGHCGKLWLYLPSGAHQPRSLPCVMITGAGSNLITGMDLGDGDRPEHLPYVRAGFAVMAYELDGALQNRQNANEAEIVRCMKSFLAARAGLVNAKNALEYLIEKVPQIDPDRVFSAGHSSAGTLSLLFAENEPRLKGCIAFAPAVDMVTRFNSQGSGIVGQLTSAGYGDFFTRYNPRLHEQDFACPVLLFHAQDDSNVPVSESTGLAQRLRQAGKDVTLELVPTGDHYDSMINQGIPKAIEWLKTRAGI
jgi:dienelactone hydrolase